MIQKRFLLGDQGSMLNQAQSEHKHSLTFRILRYVLIATKPVHWLQSRPKVHNYRAPPTIPQRYIHVCTVVWDRESDRHTDGHDQYTFCLGYASREM